MNIGDSQAKRPGDILIIKNVCPWQEALIMNLGIIALDDVNIALSPIYHDFEKRTIVFWCILCEKIKGIDYDADPSIAEYRVDPNPEHPFLFPIKMKYELDGNFIIHSTGFELHWAGVTMPFQQIRISGMLDENLTQKDDITIIFKTPVRKIPLFGNILKMMNVKNKKGDFIVCGTARIEKARRPLTSQVNVDVKRIRVEDSSVKAYFGEDSKVTSNDHLCSIV
ncbi:MAG: hypothetical protein ACTSXP_08760, partial [Promethearchaeota archaeon]